MRAVAVRAAPLALVAGLAEWTAFDLYRYASPTAWALGGVVLALAVLAAVWGSRASHPPWHRASRALLAVAFMGERLFAAGIDVVPMIAYLVLLLVLASVQGLERTFGPVYDTLVDAELLRKVDAAALGAYARALGLLGLTFVGSMFLLLVVPIAAIPGRTLVFALGLALALLFVVMLLALSPSLPEKRGP